MVKKILLCGSAGWIMEVVWTGLNSFLAGDLKMMAHTSLIMFPIYAAAAFLIPLKNALSGMPVFLRGVIYALFIFAVEYFTGAVLKSFGICPWDYSGSKFNIDGVIRLDYAPVWFTAGLLFERLIGGMPKTELNTEKL